MPRLTPMCVNCGYFFHHDDGCELDEGTCHRNPPIVTYVAEEECEITSWPHVDWTDWCGEYCDRKEFAVDILHSS